MMACFRSCALGASLILISGCGATQGIPSSAGAASASTRGASPLARGHDLLYYSAETSSYTTYFFTFPQGKLVGSFSGGGELCSDTSGNVWIAGYPNGVNNELAEFAHGGTSPIRILDVADRADDCAVDPTTGDLAVTVSYGSVDVFSGGSSPQTFTVAKLYPWGCTYDGSGNLFVIVVGHGSNDLGVAELPKGGKRFERLRVQIGLNATSGLRWDGKHLTVGQGLNQGGHELYRYVVRGDRLRQRSGVALNGDFKALADYWIQSSKVIATNNGGSHIYAPIFLFNYPSGGYPTKTIGEGVVPPANDASVTVSVAPK